MHGLTRPFGLAVALLCSLALVTGTALAAPPGTPPGQEKKAEAEAAPAAQSQQAPGQEQKAASSEPAVQQQAQPGSTPAANKGQEQKAARASAASSTKVKTQGINSTSAGVKPSNGTAKNTTCWTGGSMPSPTCRRDPAVEPADSSKRYGNGTTAAQIAVSRGAPTDTEIRGPGNSQPHKVCGKNGNWVDVHAVKSYDGVCVETTATAPPTANVTPPTPSVLPPTTFVVPPTSGLVTPTTPAPGAAVGAAVGAGAVAGAQGELGVAESGPGAGGGVLGAFGVLGASGTLPFTGFPLWAVALLGLAAIAAGLTLRRRARPALRSLA